MGDDMGAGRPEALMRLAVDNLSDLIIVLRPEGRVVALNHGAGLWLGLARENIIGRLLVDLADHSAVVAANRALLIGMPGILGKVSRSAMPFAEDEMTLFDAERRLVQRLAGDIELVTMAQRITREAAQPFVIGGRDIRVGASVGVGVGGEHTSVDELLCGQTSRCTASSASGGHITRASSAAPVSSGGLPPPR